MSDPIPLRRKLSLSPEQIARMANNPTKAKSKRQAFEPKWVKFPTRWMRALRKSTSVRTYQLAVVILVEELKQRPLGREVVLTSQVTGMPRSSSRRATTDLVKLGLIEVQQEGQQAVRVLRVHY
jgi:hypothetical protein